MAHKLPADFRKAIESDLLVKDAPAVLLGRVPASLNLLMSGKGAGGNGLICYFR